MPVFIHDIGTAVPPTAYRQSFLRDRMLRQFPGKTGTQLLVRRLYDRSGIDLRHSVVTDFREDETRFLFFDPSRGVQNPGTATRNSTYIEAANRLALEIGRTLLLAPEARFQTAEVTHLITVSCTGCAAPGFDYLLARELRLPASLHRFHIGFMGCFAAFQALQMASAFCRTDPDAVVMIVCVEICTIHLQLDAKPDHLVAGALFADGAAGALLSAKPPAGYDAYRVETLASTLAPGGEQDMVWRLGDSGFDIRLSRYVPAILESHVGGALESILARLGASDDPPHFAIHPGGRAILDKVESALKLKPAQLSASRSILARYGNMSSATILFVLAHLLSSANNRVAKPVVAAAFGPGITIESGLLTLLPAGVPS